MKGLGWIRVSIFWFSFSFSFPISIPFQTQLFEFKLKFEFKPYALNQIKICTSMKCTNMLN